MAATGTLSENLEKIAPYRARLAEQGLKNMINGEQVDALSGETFENGTPVDGSLLCTVAKGDAADIDAAAQAAKAAFPAWATMPAKQRRDLLYRVAELIEENAARLKTQGAAIQKQAASTQLSMESLERAFADINAALDDIATFRQNALPTMAENILGMERMTAEAENRIQQQEQGNQAAPTIELDFTAPV